MSVDFRLANTDLGNITPTNLEITVKTPFISEIFTSKFTYTQRSDTIGYSRRQCHWCERRLHVCLGQLYIISSEDNCGKLDAICYDYTK